MTTAPTAPPALTVAAWRDYDPHTRGLDGMYLGQVPITGSTTRAVRRLWELGARSVELPVTVDLSDTRAALPALQALCLVRDLSARGIYVDWRLRPGPYAAVWQELGGLQPPGALDGAAGQQDILGQWRRGYYVGKCLWRQGPGFIQIRDRRFGELRRFTVDEPGHQAAIALLEGPVQRSAVPVEALTDLEAERLVATVGEYVCFLPYRVQRWTQVPMVV